MPRPLPRLDLTFAASARAAISLVQRIEGARVAGRPEDQDRIRLNDVELAYELAYLRVFTAWEVLLEDIFVRLMCGYTRGGAAEALVGRAVPYRKISDAEAAMLHGQQFVLWHNSAKVINRANLTLVTSNFAQVIASAQGRLDQLSAIRHRIAHDQRDAAVNFNAASMSMAGRRYKGSRPGRFLRDISSNPPARWLSELTDQLESLARQLCI
jgi:hypothetical protein